MLLSLCLTAGIAHAEKKGEVSTEFILTRPNSKIVIEAFDDPLIPAVTCHVSYPTKGGIKGALGLVEERSEASIACRQTGMINIRSDYEDGLQCTKSVVGEHYPEYIGSTWDFLLDQK